jgi:hypothetical protein
MVAKKGRGETLPRISRPRNSRARERQRQTYPYNMHQHQEPRPRDDQDAATDISRDLAEIASHIVQLKGEATHTYPTPTTTDSS